MRVLIIPEDPTLDQHVLKPIVERLFSDLGRRPRIDVLTDPHLRGVEQALKQSTLAEIVEDNAMIDLFLLMVDRDCDRQNNTEAVAARLQEHAGKMIAVLAWQEVEVWPLALHRASLRTPWSEIRAHCDPKEAFWDPFVADRRWLGTVGKGRKKAMRELGSAWRGLLEVCPELKALKEDLNVWLQARRASRAD